MSISFRPWPTSVLTPSLCVSHDPTQGASLGWTLEAGDGPPWELYTGPLRLVPGQTVTVRAKATRIGYLESRETAATFFVK